jgi:hypothetical protein
MVQVEANAPQGTPSYGSVGTPVRRESRNGFNLRAVVGVPRTGSVSCGAPCEKSMNATPRGVARSACCLSCAANGQTSCRYDTCVSSRLC